MPTLLTRFTAGVLLTVWPLACLLSGCTSPGTERQAQAPPERSHGLVQPTPTERDNPEAVAALAGLSALGYVFGAFDRHADRPTVEQPTDENFQQASRNTETGLKQ